MKRKRIVVCDDDPRSQETWRQRLLEVKAIKKRFRVDCMSTKDLVEAIASLEKRRALARSRSLSNGISSDQYLDDVDIFVIDYDLINVDANKGLFITGEGVAYLARCYSTCGLIIALNQFGDNIFDLTLKGHPESFADLNLGGSQIDNPGLWSEPWAGFRPWYWPLLPLYLEAFESRSTELRGHLDEPVLEYLGFPPEVILTLSRSVLGFLEGKKLKHGGNATEITFREFVTSSGNAFRPKDKPLSDDGIARIAAARIGKWLERMVLPGQDILIDSPHLVSRFPTLLKNNRHKIETWNRATSLSDVPSVLRHQLLDKFMFSKVNWLSRVAWFWNSLSSYEKIAEVAEPWSLEQSDRVFCEDLSSFLPRKFTLEFVADLQSPFVRRFVSKPNAIHTKKNIPSVKAVNYRPEVRFSL
jgi:hypothetical protein